MKGRSKTLERAQKNPVRKSIPTNRNQEESEDFSDKVYRPEDDVMTYWTYTLLNLTVLTQYESTIDSVRNCIINECEFSKTSCIETESDLDKPANAEFAKHTFQPVSFKIRDNGPPSSVTKVWKIRLPDWWKMHFRL